MHRAASRSGARRRQADNAVYRILSSRSGKPLRQIIKDTKRNDFYLDAEKALEYGLIDAIVAGELPAPAPAVELRDVIAQRAAEAIEPSPAQNPDPARPQPRAHQTDNKNLRTWGFEDFDPRIGCGVIPFLIPQILKSSNLCSRPPPFFEQPRGVPRDRA